MSDVVEYPKRLIEVDLPIKKISIYARKEKSVTKGQVSTLHIWWARRPLAACRAVICASLWLDPSDLNCPTEYVNKVSKLLKNFYDPLNIRNENYENPEVLRNALLDLVADLSDWDNVVKDEYIQLIHNITEIAFKSYNKIDDKPMVVDPFSGGGSIPLESLRVGCNCYSSDLNPIPVLLNKIELEFIAKYHEDLLNNVHKLNDEIKKKVRDDLKEYYPLDKDGSTPIAYIWSRTIKCEGPNCGAEIPLYRSQWLAKKGNNSIKLERVIDKNEKTIDFKIVENVTASKEKNGTISRKGALCPICNNMTPLSSVRRQLKLRKGGAKDSRLLFVVSTKPGKKGRFYRLPNDDDYIALEKANRKYNELIKEYINGVPLIPNEPTPRGGGKGAGRAFSQRNYGMDTFEDLFTQRQLITLTTFLKYIDELNASNDFELASKSILAVILSKMSNNHSSICYWNSTGQKQQGTYVRQALPISWDFCEATPFGGSVGDWDSMVECFDEAYDSISYIQNIGQVSQGSATKIPLPNESVDCFITDPPYYDAVPYSDLSDYFYVWLKRLLNNNYNSLFKNELTPKNEECIVDEIKGKDKNFFEKCMEKSMAEGKRVLKPNGVGVIIFAHKTTSGWEAQFQAMISAGWIITASWPIDTEMGTRLRAQESAALASSIHLVCRPRVSESTGDWRDVLNDLPIKIHEWMPRLSEEGIVGADAIFACLGPALEIYSKYSKVEKASGEAVILKEYLEYVWAAISKEALNNIFKDADATGFEEDARLTAIWLWTLITPQEDKNTENNDYENEIDNEDSSSKSKSVKGYILEFDAARKISQGLGVHLENLTTLVEIMGENARLLPVEERRQYLFNTKKVITQSIVKKPRQRKLIEALDDEDLEKITNFEIDDTNLEAGNTTLDRVHQSMLLFSDGKTETLKRFLIEDGVGKDEKFWRLAQALVALYPSGSDEKRWIESVLAKKKGFGL